LWNGLCGINKISSMFWKGGLGMCPWRNIMMGHLRAMAMQNTSQHSSRRPTISQIWKTI
jgi:hypothetical protein